MSPADLARLEIAKRAYQAAQPRAAEVQTGVRRARLGLGRPKPRRNWFSKGLVLVVLALGSLAYAKPQALGELVQNAIRPSPPLPRKHLGGASELPSETNQPPRLATKPAVVVEPSRAVPAVVASAGRAMIVPMPALAGGSATAAGTVLTLDPTPAPSPASATAPVSAVAPAALAPTTALVPAAAGAATPTEAPSAATPTAGSKAARATARTADEAGAHERGTIGSSESSSSSEWGRVGRALARGDDARALSALAQLSESADASTRDKADLGRAQLFMAHGNEQQACALARSLLQRRAGVRIERQAQGLLKNCPKQR